MLVPPSDLEESRVSFQNLFGVFRFPEEPKWFSSAIDVHD